MTAPVNQSPAIEGGEKIEMTAPVEQTPHRKTADTYVFSFVMPSKYTMEMSHRVRHPMKRHLLVKQQSTSNWATQIQRL